MKNINAGQQKLHPVDGMVVLLLTVAFMRLLSKLVRDGIISLEPIAGCFPGGLSVLNLQLTAQLIQTVVMIGVTCCALKFRGSSLGEIGFRKPKDYWWLLWSLALGICTFTVMIVLTGIISRIAPQLVHPQEAEAIIRLAHSDWDYVAVFLMVGIMAPISEEMLFRGYIYHSMSSRWGIVLAIVVTSLLFGSMHNDLFRMLQLSLIGAYLNCILLKGNSIWASIITHSVWNTGMTFLLLVAGYSA